MRSKPPWRKLRRSGHFDSDRMHFLYDLGEEDSYDGGEMEMTVHYLMDTAVQAGWITMAHPMAEVGWNPETRDYRDVHDEPLRNAFKLYAWEEMLAEPFGRHVVEQQESRPTRWIEPASEPISIEPSALTRACRRRFVSVRSVPGWIIPISTKVPNGTRGAVRFEAMVFIALSSSSRVESIRSRATRT
jgi:hypothetical protein